VVTSLPPVSAAQLRRDIAGLGLAAGGTVLVQASMREIGWIDGGESSLLGALRAAVGPNGTIVTPTQTANNSTTTTEFVAAARERDAAGRRALEDAIAGFDYPETESYRMGRLAEAVRTSPGAVRSRHPQTSFAAVGPASTWLMAVHDLGSHLGERSPLSRLYSIGATIVLIGRPFDFCTGLHLAEHRLPWPPPTRPYRCYVISAGRRERVDFTAPDLDDGDFRELGQSLEASSLVETYRVGSATTRVVPMRQAVDFAVDWMASHRRPRDPGKIQR
jgi:aminoglycoside 3-N-acetyltransferase